ncbi:MAG: aspartate-semialdehyde dehydrogenase [Sphingomonadales bacterium]|nr:aspartate-semialdehyde dehydrogenase [Sphingomonadales bacterium]NCQ21300.1 aspartate-semialdehyde dehydrogenase [Sphingomonadales bacterium]NCT03464.1 aspartate-semialdehyde dehydrogenase [Sphingomonadales bacterium]
MRFAFLAVTCALALTGCDNGDVPSPAERQQGEAAQAPVATDRVELRGDGLSAGSESFYFAAGQAEVEGALAKTLGASFRSGQNAECGAGPITFTDFAGGLTAHFQQGRLVGWNWHAPQDGDAAPTGTVGLSGDVQVGSARAAVEAATGFALVEGSTLGEEFALGSKIGGFIAGDRVEMLYAGTQCFFR